MANESAPPPGSFADNPLVPIVYAELRALAGSFFRSERHSHTLQPTALVHEAWLRLAKQGDVALGDRTAFLVVAAITMRRILVEHARRRNADKRGGQHSLVTLDDAMADRAEGGLLEIDVLAVHEALEELAALSARQAQIVEMRWFGGLTVPEVAGILGLTTRTVEKDWTLAKAWLRRRLAPSSP